MVEFAVSESHVILIKIYCARKRKKSVAICICSPISYFNVFKKLLFHSAMMKMKTMMMIAYDIQFMYHLLLTRSIAINETK